MSGGRVMSGAAVLNRVRHGFYLDSVALMRHSQAVAALVGIETASIMIGSQSNKGIMEDAGLLADEGRAAEPNDLIIAVRAESAEARRGGAGRSRGPSRPPGGGGWQSGRLAPEEPGDGARSLARRQPGVDFNPRGVRRRGSAPRPWPGAST